MRIDRRPLVSLVLLTVCLWPASSSAQGEVRLPFNARVTCEFATPGAEKGGNTPKFDSAP